MDQKIIDTIQVLMNEGSKAFQGCDYIVITQPSEHNVRYIYNPFFN